MDAWRSALFSLLLLLASVRLAMAQGTYTQIDYPGATLTSAQSINTAGDIVGSYRDVNGSLHGFLLSRGTYTTIDYPGTGIETILTGINDNGQIAGTLQYPDLAFLYDIQTQTFTTFGFSNAYNTDTYGINNNGVVVGFTGLVHGSQEYLGFKTGPAGRGKTILTFPGAASTYATGVSTSGLIVGYYYSSGFRHTGSFVFEGGKYRNLQIPVGSPAILGVNPQGTAFVGQAVVSGNQIGFLYANNTLQTIAFPGSVTTFARSINSAGEIVGSFGETSYSGIHGFIWTPSPDAPKP